jgi:hypothetical protein
MYIRRLKYAIVVFKCTYLLIKQATYVPHKTLDNDVEHMYWPAHIIHVYPDDVVYCSHDLTSSNVSVTRPIRVPKNDSHDMTMPTMNPSSSHCLATGCASTLNPGRVRYPQQAGPSTPAIDPNQAWAAGASEWPTRPMQCIVTAHRHGLVSAGSG